MDRKYRMKQPVEAFQLTEEAFRDEASWPQWLVDARNRKMYEDGPLFYDDSEAPSLDNSHGEERFIDFRDYIVMDATGDLTVYTSEDFEKMFEKVQG